MVRTQLRSHISLKTYNENFLFSLPSLNSTTFIDGSRRLLKTLSKYLSVVLVPSNNNIFKSICEVIKTIFIATHMGSTSTAETP